MWRKQEANVTGNLSQRGCFSEIKWLHLVPPNGSSLWEAALSPFTSQSQTLPIVPSFHVGWVGGRRMVLRHFTAPQGSLNSPSHIFAVGVMQIHSVRVEYRDFGAGFSSPKHCQIDLGKSPFPSGFPVQKTVGFLQIVYFLTQRWKVINNKRKYPWAHWQTPEHFESDETLCASKK